MKLNDKKYLYAIGCSHMAGSEIAGPGITSSLKQNVNNAWPGQLAIDNNLNYINQSVPGGSNEYIMRTCIDFVSRWIANTQIVWGIEQISSLKTNLQLRVFGLIYVPCALALKMSFSKL